MTDHEIAERPLDTTRADFQWKERPLHYAYEVAGFNARCAAHFHEHLPQYEGIACALLLSKLVNEPSP
jgi:hypothetical protein